jgi:hypothetical protein
VKPIIAQDQVILGVGRCITLAMTGMSYRLFRSLITVAILALAVAFLTHMLGYGFLAHRTQVAAYAELSETRLLGEWTTRLTQVDAPRAVMLALAAHDESRTAEYARWSGAESGEIEWAQEVARNLGSAERLLQSQAPAARAALIGDDTPGEMLARLADAREHEAFMDRMVSLRVTSPLGSPEAFTRLVREDRPRLMQLIDRIQAGHRAAIVAVRDAAGGVTPRDMFAEPPVGLAATIADAGFTIDDDLLVELNAQAVRGRHVAALTEAMTSTEVRGALARQMDIPLPDVNLAAAFRWLTSDSRTTWFVNMLEEQKRGVSLSAEQISDLASRFRRQEKLQRAAGAEAPVEHEGLLALPTRTQWLIGLSFLVCVVGVANAMLMSVTERFAEIATMKCLGAMDRFVMMMFVFEATIQGLMGGLVGMLLGLLLALLRGLVEYGGLLFVPGQAWGTVFISAAASVIVGVLLAGVAAVGPAFVAARLAPMEAMRVE